MTKLEWWILPQVWKQELLQEDLPFLHVVLNNWQFIYFLMLYILMNMFCKIHNYYNYIRVMKTLLSMKNCLWRNQRHIYLTYLEEILEHI